MRSSVIIVNMASGSNSNMIMEHIHEDSVGALVFEMVSNIFRGSLTIFYFIFVWI